MKKRLAIILAAALMLSPIAGLRANTAFAATEVLRISNWEDYISQDEKTEIYLYEEFEKYLKEKGRDVKVEYSTFGTNEDLYNDLKINKKGENYSYDLVCPSDYMIQKMIAENMLETIDAAMLPIYNANVSGYIKNLFDSKGSEIGKEWSKYAVPYMWGTMGFVYNPEYVNADDISNWSALWNIDYKGKTTLKDSVRDTYFLGVAYVNRELLTKMANEYEMKKFQLEINDITQQQFDDFVAYYQAELDFIFNDTSDETIAKVEKALNSVKSTIFSFELDDGKNDMATGKVHINFAWSGDAVYAMNEAEKDGVELYYSVPKQGSNIWFDGFVMPKGANKDLAYEFLEFISRPDNAIKNMEYIGYTSAIAGDEVFEWVQSTYGAETVTENTPTVDLNYFFDNIDDAGNAIIATDVLGRQFSAQYPDKDVIARCAIMKNFDDDKLAKVNAMWQRVKGKTLPVGLIVAIIAAVVLVAGGALVYVVLKRKGFNPKAKKSWTVVKKD